jgi:hypothetical protein
MLRDHRLTMLALIIAGLSSSMAFDISLAAESNKPARLEQIPGSDLKRVILTSKAAARLAIETSAVREEPVMRWMMVGAQVEALTRESTVVAVAGQTTGATIATDAVPIQVNVPLPDGLNQMLGQAVPALSLTSKGDDDDDDDDDDMDNAATADDDDKDKDTPTFVFVMPVGGQNGPKRLRAKLVEVASSADANGVAHAYYVLDGEKQLNNLRPGQRVNVRVPRPGSGKPQKVIPYSAVIYDSHGTTWTYTNPEPLTFVRHPISVEYIQDDLAVLTEGPATGTSVVSVGASELLGVEQKFGN